MKPFRLELDVSQNEAMERLEQSIHIEPNDSVFRTSAPYVFDRLIGSISESSFEVVVYQAMIAPLAVIANGEVESFDDGVAILTEFKWGWSVARLFVLLSGIVGAISIVTGFSPLLGFIGVSLMLSAYFNRWHERKIICDNLSAIFKGKLDA